MVFTSLLMKKIYALLALVILSLAAPSLHAQCSGGSSAGAITPTAAWQTVACIQGGQYRTFVATAGVTYMFSFCAGGGSCSYDSQLTMLDNSGAYAGAYADDVCGAAPEITWTCPSNGTYRVLFNDYYCATGSTCATMAYRIYVPPVGSVCSNPIVIPALPYTVTGGTTCGFGDDYDDLDACASFYMNGDDIVYRYNSPGSESITVTLTGTSTYVGVFVMNGCPDAGGTTCMPLASGSASCGGGGSATNTSSSGNPFGTWDLTAPGNYYIIISTFPSPQCTPFNMSITSGPLSGGGGAGAACYTVSAPAYSPYSYTSGTALVFPDDEFSSVVPIGFSFCYMGAYYSNVVVSSNSYITFNTSCAGQYSPYDTDPFPLPPSDEETYNGIHFPWQDVDPSVSGTIRYNNYGTAPNRVFVVSFRNVAMFSSACNALRYTGQVVLYETSNVIDTYIQDKPVCATWVGGNAVHGLLDASGTAAVVVPGRNDTQYTLANDAIRFTPTCNPCASILPVSYTSFSGKNLGSKNHLEWATGFENNQVSFTLERSRDSRNFEDVGTVEATGSGQHETSYNMEDAHPAYPETFYRIRELDQDGNVTYSHIISVNAQKPDASLESVYAQPQGDQVFVHIDALTSMDVTLVLVDAFGREVYKKTLTLDAGMNSIEMTVPGLAAGTYFLRAETQNSHPDMKSFVKF